MRYVCTPSFVSDEEENDEGQALEPALMATAKFSYTAQETDEVCL
jgi:hypothetical protein